MRFISIPVGEFSVNSLQFAPIGVVSFTQPVPTWVALDFQPLNAGIWPGMTSFPGVSTEDVIPPYASTAGKNNEIGFNRLFMNLKCPIFVDRK